MRNLTFLAGFGLATLSGCLWFLAVTPFDHAWLAWIAAVPMLFAIDRAATFRGAVLLGWWAGLVETAGGFYWLIDVQQRFAGFPWLVAALIFFAFCAARSLIFVLSTAVIRGVRHWRPLPMALLAPLATVSGELVVPQIFPCGQWISQAWHPLVIQISELTGAMGVTALLMMVNGAVFDLMKNARAARLSTACAAVLLSATLGFGVWRMQQTDAAVAAAPHLKIGLVQPNFSYNVNGEVSRDEVLKQLNALQVQSQRLEHQGAQLLLWSEGAYPMSLARDFSQDFSPDSLARVRRGFSVPTIIGASMIDDNPAEDAFNTALLLDADGKVAGYYDKVRLLAFGEYIPGIETFPWLRRFLPDGAGRFTAGKGPKVVELPVPGRPPWRLAPVICYEDILQDFLQGVGQLKPNLLVNLTSDSWFGADTEPWEHLALSVFASVEMRVSMVRAVNSGVSAYIDPNGRVVVRTYSNDPYRNPRDADGIVVNVPMLSPATTVFVTVGNLFAYMCLTASLALSATAWWRLRRGPSPSPDG